MDRKSWLQWRQKGIGSSDAPIIHNMSKFSTLRDLYESKIATEFEEDTDNSFIKDMGNQLEPMVRETYELLTGEAYEVALVENAEFPFLIASLDGRQKSNHGKLIEIKLLGKDDYALAQAGTVPPQYLPQCQHQLIVTGGEECVFIGYPHARFTKERGKSLDSKALVEVVVKPDPDFTARHIAACADFWQNHVMKRKPPIPSADDYVSLKGQARILNAWRKQKIKADDEAEKLDALRAQLIEAAKSGGHNKYESNGVRIREESRAGSVNYKKIVDEHKFSDDFLEKYRGKGSTSWKIEITDLEGKEK